MNGNLRQTRAWDIGEVMVFIVEANIESDLVKNAVVGEGFLVGGESVVFRDKVACHGVEAHGEEGAKKEVDE